jgi:hypothetical protein
MTATPTFNDPKTWAFQEGVESSELNSNIRDNINSMGPHLIIRKPSDESVVSNITPQNDDHLKMTVGANEVWQCHWALIYDAGTAGDMRLTFTFPSGRIDFSAIGADSSGTATFRRWNTATSPATPLDLVGPGGVICFDLFGVFANGATPGDLQLQWAQNTSSGTATVMKANSTLWGVQLA